MKLTDKQPESKMRVIEGAESVIWKLRNEFDQKLIAAEPEIETRLLQWNKRIHDPIGFETVAYDEIGRLTNQTFGFDLVQLFKFRASGSAGIQQWLATNSISGTVLPNGSVCASGDVVLCGNGPNQSARPWKSLPVRFAEVIGHIDIRGHSPVDFSWLPPQERIELMCDDGTWDRLCSMFYEADSENIANEMRQVILLESQLAEGETIVSRRSVSRS